MTYANVHAGYLLKYWDGAAWVDITPDTIVAPIAGFWGMTDNRPDTIMANAGQLTFTLNNTAGKYVPELGTPATGWEKGAPVRLELTYDGMSYIGYRGRVSTLTIHNEYQEVPSVEVSCLDWFDFAAKYPVEGLSVVTDTTADVAIQSLLGLIPIQPLARSLEVGTFVFPSLNDAIATTTHGYDEMAKLVKSEWGACFLRHDRTYGETLIFENKRHRTGLAALSVVPKMKINSGLLLKANSAADHILKANSADHLILDQVDTASISDLASSIAETYAENIVNRVTVNAYPKTVDASAVILYKLGNKPLKINTGAVKVIKGKYTNPSGGRDINGMGMIAPVATTDYLMNTLADGTGTDLTADLTIVCNYDSSRPTYTLTNTSQYTGYITKLVARGFGIYQDNALTSVLESSASELKYGYEELSIDQTYQQDIDLGSMVGKKIMEFNKKPRIKVNSISFDANYSTFTMLLFLHLDIGSLIQIVDARYSVNDWFYVQGVNFSIDPGGKIKVTYTVQIMQSIANGKLSPIGLTFHDLSADGMDYGDLPILNALHEFSVAFWIRRTAATNLNATILSAYSANNGFYVFHDYTDGRIAFMNRHFDGGDNHSYCNFAVGLNTLTHVLITGNMFGFIPPLFYLDGVNRATTDTVGVGSYQVAPGSNLLIGNTMVSNLYNNAIVGYIKDVRIYNRKLTAAEAVTLYNGGAPSATVVPTGLIFQGPVVRTAELDDYEGHLLTSELLTLDNIHGVVGTPHGGPDGLAF